MVLKTLLNIENKKIINGISCLYLAISEIMAEPQYIKTYKKFQEH